MESGLNIAIGNLNNTLEMVITLNFKFLSKIILLPT